MTLSPNNESLVGSLVYIPSQVSVFKLDEQEVITKQCTLTEPAIVPLIEFRGSSRAKIYYKGESWWAHTSDFCAIKDQGETNDY